ncbi:hypothetical protein [Streptomyces sp. NPDC000134]
MGIRSSRDVRRAGRFGVLDRGVLSEVSPRTPVAAAPVPDSP